MNHEPHLSDYLKGSLFWSARFSITKIWYAYTI